MVLCAFRSVACLLGLLVFLVILSAAVAHSQGDYLYHIPEALGVINDYEPSKNKDELPDFIFGKDQGPRVVEFYAPWCPHCQHFRDHYIEFAEQTAAVLREFDLEETGIKFYAVSCTVNQKLCHKVGINGYPKVKLYAAGAHGNATADIKYWKIHPFDVLRKLDIQVDQLKVEPILKANSREQLRTQRLQHQVARTKKQLFEDAYLSFDFTLRTGIFLSPMTNATKQTFYDWLKLLQKTTPSVWQIQRTIDAILNEFDVAVQSEENLVAIADRFPPPNREWTSSCTKGVPGMGYSCGLWQLFHIMSVGLVEYNLMIATEDQDILESVSVSTVHVAETLRNFIEHFFGCEECRSNFVQVYDTCGHERCARLSEHVHNYDQWIQLPTWLFETHNAVSARLVRERAAREKRQSTDEEMEQSQWPSKRVCPTCWSDSGGYDDEAVYKFLRTEYWSEDAISAEYRAEVVVEESFYVDTTSSVHSVTVLLLALFVFFAVWYTRRLRVKQSGRHKKEEDNC